MAQTTAADPTRDKDLALEGTPEAGQRLGWRRLLQVREFGILAAAVALFIALSIARPNTFFTEDNILRIAMQISLLTILATGMTFLFIAGEIDLSIGAMYGLLALTISKMLFDWQWSPWLALPATVAAGAGIGFVNGFLTTRFNIPSFIVTLGMLGILRGIALVWIRTPPIGRSPEFDQVLAGRLFGEIPMQIFWMLGVVLIASFVLSRTKFGYHVYATGDNEVAARNAGISTKRVKLLCFVLVGALAGLAASILIAWVHGVSRGYGPGYELDVIAAVVIGGTNLFGGIGSVFGTFLGAAITGMITTGLVLLGAQQDSEPIAKGAVIILAVLLDVTVRRRQGL
jgi:ribose transport system permease protein